MSAFTTLKSLEFFIGKIMRPTNETSPFRTDTHSGFPAGFKDEGSRNPIQTGNNPPTMRVPQESPLTEKPETSRMTEAPLTGAAPAAARSSEPTVFPRDQVGIAASSSLTSKEPRKIDSVQLANHVSLQIFSTASTEKSKNAIVFLHGGPGMFYDESFENLTSWSLDHGYTLVAPEIAGSSGTGLAATSDSFAIPPNYVRDLTSVIQHLRENPDLKEKEFCAIAHSWGGFQLASMLTDENVSAENRDFFKQIVFMSPNLDSAHTRLFWLNLNSGAVDENSLVSNMKARHAGDSSNSSGNITITHNPLMDQDLNEAISPIYRLEKIPSTIPCLFVHPIRDKAVPASQSLAAFETINSNAGNAKIIMTTTGDHGFFKTGANNDAYTMTACFGAIDSFIRDPDSLKKTAIDGDFPDASDPEAIEMKIKEKDSSYKSQKNLLNEWHGKADTELANKAPNKIQALTTIKEYHERNLKNLESRGMTIHPSFAITKEKIAELTAFLENHKHQ